MQSSDIFTQRNKFLIHKLFKCVESQACFVFSDSVQINMTNIIFFVTFFLGLNLYLSCASVLVIYILYCTCSCSGRESRIPAPPAGHHWKELRHDNTVTWLVSWTENIQGSNKYIMLNANSKLKVSYLLHNGGDAHTSGYKETCCQSCRLWVQQSSDYFSSTVLKLVLKKTSISDY